jgi:hypothetical protein
MARLSAPDCSARERKGLLAGEYLFARRDATGNIGMLVTLPAFVFADSMPTPNADFGEITPRPESGIHCT